ncbi:flagellar basal-body MS-ring/collar protein FliF [Salisediminibacterium halotolerans]|uniref:Flagellar M-ring protein n=1 Tax=Salisediminibacterium halotolerans TaxID=517425 RepID=A0A1H9Q3A9_9BACI|nr:flagellar basal-body MS-ring/collar protein FliF [Salisediminibacterium haloalkalitolerans]SER54898.1 flagellar M-ring protein FliF [Salisediminibacterium haloalkalitolerans]
MNEKVLDYKKKTTEFWQSRTKKQQGLLVAAAALLLIVILAFSWMGSRTNYVPLYTNLTEHETGEIKAELDGRGIANEISADGTVIRVPEERADDLRVDLAAEGIPDSGRIDYSTFGDNMGFGTTDSEFELLERAAIQSSIEDLMRNVDGVQSSQVMITMPEESVWVGESDEEATASVLVNLEQGFSLENEQIRALHHLVSRSVPNLPLENIVIMDQMSRHLTLEDEPRSGDGSMSAYEEHRAIQQEIEADIQNELQQMLGMLIGPDKVVATVNTDIDFTQENRMEDLVEPVDEENMEGLAISVENITDTYEGEAVDEEVAGTGDDDIPNFPAAAGGGAGDSERIEERINYDVNRIHREISESPYMVRDIGIQVMVEPPEPEDPNSLPPETLNDIEEILGQVVRTSVSADITAEWEDDEIADRVYVSSQEFFGRTEVEEAGGGIPSWVYVAGAAGAAVIVLVLILARRQRSEDTAEAVTLREQEEFQLPPIDEEPNTEEAARRKQLEQLAKDKPEEFSKLIRTWLSED